MYEKNVDKTNDLCGCNCDRTHTSSNTKPTGDLWTSVVQEFPMYRKENDRTGAEAVI